MSSRITAVKSLLCAAVALCAIAACTTRRETPSLEIPRLPCDVVIDGKLDETCYTSAPLVGRFVVAGAPESPTSGTRVWLYWNDDRLVFAFDCEDADIVASPPTDNERAAEAQDRVELFFWSGRMEDGYYCFEHAPEGALHDSHTMFYRKVNRRWDAQGYHAAFQRTPKGYTAEGEFPKSLLDSMGFRLRPGEKWRLGLFRADFDGGGSARWLTWIDRDAPPDFHVAESFGCVELR
jgi:hypothetical protein